VCFVCACFAAGLHVLVSGVRIIGVQILALVLAAMNRSDLIVKLSSRFPQLTKEDADFAVNAILDEITGCLAINGRVEIRGFGVFSIHTRPTRTGRNPKTGEKVAIPQKNVPHFKPGQELRSRVNS
jgi:integration host factor subunit beta